MDALDFVGDRPVRSVPAASLVPVAHGPGGVVLCRSENSRGPFEVLVCSAQRHLLGQPCPLVLSGFWRRRSGLRADGSRHFIWTLIPVDVATQTSAACA